MGNREISLHPRSLHLQASPTRKSRRLAYKDKEAEAKKQAKKAAKDKKKAEKRRRKKAKKEKRKAAKTDKKKARKEKEDARKKGREASEKDDPTWTGSEASPRRAPEEPNLPPARKMTVIIGDTWENNCLHAFFLAFLGSWWSFEAQLTEGEGGDARPARRHLSRLAPGPSISRR